MNADCRDFILSCLKKRKGILGMGVNLRISEKICVLLKSSIFTRRLYEKFKI